MDRTNYTLLSIVGVVAVVAIIAMTLSAGRSALQVGPEVRLVDGRAQDDTASLTGNVALERTQRPTVEPRPRLRPDFDYASYDYDASGTYDTPDALILGEVVDRQRFCPEDKTCDLNGDGIVDIADLGVFNARLLEERMRAEASPLTGRVTDAVQPSPRASTTGPLPGSAWGAVTGAPLP